MGKPAEKALFKMRILTAKTVRLIARLCDSIRSSLLTKYFELKYPGCKFKSTHFGRGVSIVCTDGAFLTVNNSSIGDGSLIYAGRSGMVDIQSSFIGRNCIIAGCEKITIGENCLIAEMTVIRDQNHQYSDSTIPISEQEMTTSSINIGQNVWLGAKVTVLAGTNIASNTVVGAHSLVNTDLKGGMYAGIPAKYIKSLSVEKSKN